MYLTKKQLNSSLDPCKIIKNTLQGKFFNLSFSGRCEVSGLDDIFRMGLFLIGGSVFIMDGIIEN